MCAVSGPAMRMSWRSATLSSMSAQSTIPTTTDTTTTKSQCPLSTKRFAKYALQGLAYLFLCLLHRATLFPRVYCNTALKVDCHLFDTRRFSQLFDSDFQIPRSQNPDLFVQFHYPVSCSYLLPETKLPRTTSHHGVCKVSRRQFSENICFWP